MSAEGEHELLSCPPYIEITAAQLSSLGKVVVFPSKKALRNTFHLRHDRQNFFHAWHWKLSSKRGYTHFWSFLSELPTSSRKKRMGRVFSLPNFMDLPYTQGGAELMLLLVHSGSRLCQAKKGGITEGIRQKQLANVREMSSTIARPHIHTKRHTHTSWSNGPLQNGSVKA